MIILLTEHQSTWQTHDPLDDNSGNPGVKGNFFKLIRKPTTIKYNY